MTEIEITVLSSHASHFKFGERIEFMRPALTFFMLRRDPRLFWRVLHYRVRVWHRRNILRDPHAGKMMVVGHEHCGTYTRIKFIDPMTWDPRI